MNPVSYTHLPLPPDLIELLGKIIGCAFEHRASANHRWITGVGHNRYRLSVEIRALHHVYHVQGAAYTVKAVCVDLPHFMQIVDDPLCGNTRLRI